MSDRAPHREACPQPREHERPAAYADRIGRWYASHNTAEHKKSLGQFLTPLTVAYYIAGLYRASAPTITVLDPGAGAGVLACAVCEVLATHTGITTIHVEAYETDAALAQCLAQCLTYAQRWLAEREVALTFTVCIEDFVLKHAEVLEPTPRLIQTEDAGRIGFDLVIANPPYFKIPKSDVRARAAAAVVHGQPNIYALFMAIAALLLKPDGRLIFITPRSYAAGPYFRVFRERFFTAMQPEMVHLFGSRRDMFSRDEVLQENVILLARRADRWHVRVNGATVDVSFSTGTHDLHCRTTRSVPIADVLDFATKEKVLRIPASNEHDDVTNLVQSWTETLHSLGMNISTGPVVAFRAETFLEESGTRSESLAPLLWMQNVSAMRVAWPLQRHAKPQYIAIRPASSPLLLKNDNYVVLRRFSAKEEHRRITAAPLLASEMRSSFVGLENHLNYIYRVGGSLSEEEAYGLAALLNSALLDGYFRISNGNTQVSATELRTMPFPTLDAIRRIGACIMRRAHNGERATILEEIDRAVAEILGLKPSAAIAEAVNVKG